MKKIHNSISDGNKARTKKRADAKKEFAQLRGFTSWSALETQILNENVKLIFLGRR